MSKFDFLGMPNFFGYVCFPNVILLSKGVKTVTGENSNVAGAQTQSGGMKKM